MIEQFHWKFCDKMKLGCDYLKTGNHLHLCHFVAFPLPAKPLIVQRIIIGPDENRLPVNETACPFADMKHVKILGFRRFLPLFASRNVVTARTQFFMKGDSRTSLQHLNLQKLSIINFDKMYEISVQKSAYKRIVFFFSKSYFFHESTTIIIIQ